MIITEFWCPGQPKTKGSLSARRGDDGLGGLTDTPQSKAWRRLMAGACRDDLARRDPATLPSKRTPYDGAVAVTAYWFLPREPTAYQAGDIDKLLRNLLDALSAPTPKRTTDISLCAGAIRDDNQVVGVPESWEFYDAERPGVLAQVRIVPPEEIAIRRLHALGVRDRLTA